MYPTVKSPYYQSRNGKKIDGVVIHTTVGFYQGTITYFQNNTRSASSHYVTSLKGEVTQMVDEVLASNHAGIISNPKKPAVYHGYNPNWNTIGIENADDNNPAGADRTLQMPILAKLVKEICVRHGIPMDRDHIIGHRELYDKKTCPGNIDLDKLVAMVNGNSTIDNMDPDKTRAIKNLDDYRVKRVQGPEGNYEGYVASVIGSDQKSPALKKDLENSNLKVAQAVSALEVADTQIESQKEVIVALNKQITTLSEKLGEVVTHPPTINPTPEFKNPVAAFFYKLAVFAEK